MFRSLQGLADIPYSYSGLIFDKIFDVKYIPLAESAANSLDLALAKDKLGNAYSLYRRGRGGFLFIVSMVTSTDVVWFPNQTRNQELEMLTRQKDFGSSRCLLPDQ